MQRISGVDLNHELAERSRGRGVEVIETDMETLLTPSKYDLVVSYGSLHHAADTRQFVRTLGRLSNEYVLIVDNTVRRNIFHKVTGSRHFPLELSPYRIRSREEIVSAFDGEFDVVSSVTFRNANLFHDRSFVLARRLGGDAPRKGPTTKI
ncbi:MAG: trans-aconitate 2-methyltransferase [Vicinamibacterales bacterium]